MYQLLSDQPGHDRDRFDFDPMAGILRDVVVQTPSPFTIGIFGEWGSGKTTLMRLIDAKLVEAGHKTVWFNAWKYDGKEVVWNALIQSIFLKMKTDADAQDEAFLERVAEAGKNLARFAARKWLGTMTAGVINDETLEGVLGALAPLTADDKQLEFINAFEMQFKELVEDYLGGNGRLVIFVDDLDRCLPETAVEVLEAVKLYLDTANVTFVIGVEPEVVREGIRIRYKENPVLAGKEYLEKIVQLPFMMRGLSEDMALELLSPFEKTSQYVNDPIMTSLIFTATEKNPRRIKRFINTFYVLTEMQRVAGSELSREDSIRLALVLLTQLHFSEFFEAMERSPGIVQEWNEADRLPSGQRAKRIEASEDLQQIDANGGIQHFFSQVGRKDEEVDCSEEKMKRWIILTEGKRPSTVNTDMR